MTFFNYRWRDLPAIIALAGLYALVAKIVLSYFAETGNVTLIWFSGGLGLAALILRGLRYWPGIFIGALAAGLLVDDSFWLSTAIATGNTLESVTAAYLLKRNPHFCLELTRPRDFIWLSLTGAVCSSISAAIGPWALYWAGFIPMPAMPQTVLHWWMADAFGIVTATPMLLVWRNWPSQWFAEKRGMEALLLILLTLFVGEVVFLDTFQSLFGKFARGYWMFLFSIWAAVRFNRHGVTLIASLITIQALLGAAHHQGFFGDDYQKSDLLNLWFYILVLSWTGTTLALALHNQKLITQGLADSERRLKAIIDASPVPQAVYDVQGNITLVNPAFINTLGYTLADIQTLDEWWPKAYPDPAYRQRVMTTWQTLVDVGQQTQNFETIQADICCKNGEIRTVRAGSVSLGASYVGNNLVILFDITEQLKSDKALAESNLLLQTILDTLPIRVFWKDKLSRYLGCNRLFARDASANSAADLIGRSDAELAWQAQAKLYQADDMSVMASGQAKLNFEEPQTTPAGSTIWLRTSKLPLYNSDQQIIGVLGVYDDITQSKLDQQKLAESISLLQATLEATAEGILVVNLQGHIRSFNRRFLDLWHISHGLVHEGDESGQLQSFVVGQIKHPEQYLDRIYELYAQPAAESYDLLEFNDGRLMERYSRPQRIGNEIIGRVWSFSDVTERSRNEEKLRLAALVYQNSSEAMVVTDADNTILSINPAFTAMTGYEAEDVIGKDPRILSSGEHSTEFYREMWQAINATGTWRGEIKNRRRDGRLYDEELTINTIYNGDGTVQRRVALFSDITQRKQSEEQIWQQANFDPLTGLPNRRMFRDRLEQEIKKAHRMGQLFGLLFIDLDRFKEINDTLGHEMGDLLLKETAWRLKTCVRESDTVARLGGDEFTVILSELDCFEHSELIAKNLLQKLSAPFSLDDELVYVSASIGITFYPDDGSELGQLLKNADQAMYAAKNQGRNSYSFFTKALQDALQTRAALLSDLRIALADNQFALCYQPIVDLLNGEIHKAEALLRWQHPTRGLISPAEFIPLAEETGLINEIGDWVFQTAANQVGAWRSDIHAEFQISINKSPIQFQNASHVPNHWFEYLKQLGLSGQSIVVEITEGLLLDANLAVHNHLMAFRDAGMQVAIDDFGTGYSALSYLKKFDIDYLKIDQSFVRNLSADSSDFALCEAMIVMAHKLGLRVIAEGVETQQQRDLLTSINCDYGQGYLFAKPLPAELFEQRFGRMGSGK